jgi:FKBP-type peptidyl-prolyl cis-trans isomerase
MRSVKLLFLAVLGASILCSQAFAAEHTKLTTDKERMNYAVGVNVIKNFQQQGFDVDLDVLVQGMRDALGGKVQMSDEEFKKTMHDLQDEVRRRQKMAPIIALREGETFLAENGKKKGVETLPSGLQYTVLKEGTGPKPKGSDMVLCNYRGTLLNGSEFDRSYPGKPVTFSVEEGGGIPGLSEALRLMPVGSEWKLFIPPKLAYGTRGRLSVVGSTVGPNETIIVQVELLSIK